MHRDAGEGGGGDDRESVEWGRRSTFVIVSPTAKAMGHPPRSLTVAARKLWAVADDVRGLAPTALTGVCVRDSS